MASGIRSRIVKVCIVFFAVMLFATFFSRSVFAWLTPKVEIRTPAYAFVRREIIIPSDSITKGRESCEFILRPDAALFKSIVDVQWGEITFWAGKDPILRHVACKVQVSWDDLSMTICESDESLPSDVEIQQIKLFADSYELVIPAYALVEGNQVYVVEQRKGFSEEELYIHRTDVVVEILSWNQAVVLEGVAGEDQIITGWDRPLHDKQRVMLPLD